MNQPPPTQKQTGKRIVSKGAYVRKQTERVSNGALGVCLWLAALLFALFSLVCCIAIPANVIIGFASEHIVDGVGKAFYSLCGAAVTGYGAFFLYRTGSNLLNDAVNASPIVPLTRANTADLPAPDTLVRASLEPRQEQQLRHEVASTIVWPRMKR